jgi:hypothetical protein
MAICLRATEEGGKFWKEGYRVALQYSCNNGWTANFQGNFRQLSSTEEQLKPLILQHAISSFGTEEGVGRKCENYQRSV